MEPKESKRVVKGKDLLKKHQTEATEFKDLFLLARKEADDAPDPIDDQDLQLHTSCGPPEKELRCRLDHLPLPPMEDHEAPRVVAASFQPASGHFAPPPETSTAAPAEEAQAVPKKLHPTVLQRICISICGSPVFEPAVLALILISSIALAVDTPYMDSKSKAKQLLDAIEKVVSMAFFCEMLCKMIAHSLFAKEAPFVEGQVGYFRSTWNWIDFTIVMSSVVDFAMSMFASAGDSFLEVMRALRLLRALRPLRMIQRNKGLKIIVEALISAMPTLMRTLIIAGLFYIGFAILFMNLLKGELWRCSLDPTGFERSDIVTREDCERLGGKWINANSNFDHVGHALASTLHMGTGEGWLDVGIDVVNSVGVDMQPRRDKRLPLIFLIIVFVWVGSSFLVNLMIGVLTDQYGETKDLVQGTELITAKEKKWLGVQQRLLGRADLLMAVWTPGDGCLQRARVCTQKLVDRKSFDNFIFLCICANTVTMALNIPTMSETERDNMDVVGKVFLGIFNVELLLKVFIYLGQFFKDNWNVFDMVIVIGSDAEVITSIFVSGQSAMLDALEAFRILRAVRLVRMSPFLNNYLTTLLALIPALLNVSLLLVLLLFIYACLGMGLFSTLAPGEVIGPDINFHNFGNALLLVFRVSTGEEWHKIMYDTVNDRPNCTTDAQSAKDLDRDGPRGCGTFMGYPFFITFTSFVSIVILNIIIAVILEGFQAMEEVESYSLYLREIQAAAKAWLAVDVKGAGYLTMEEAALVMSSIPQPVGYQGKIQKKVLHQMRYLPIYDGRVHFRDVVVFSAKRVYTWINHMPESTANEVKIDPVCFGRWCSYFPDVPRPDRSIQSFLVGHVIVKRFLDQQIVRRRRIHRAHMAENFIREQILDAMPLRKHGVKGKITSVKTAEPVPAAEGRNAAGLFLPETQEICLDVASQMGGPPARPNPADFEAPMEPTEEQRPFSPTSTWPSSPTSAVNPGGKAKKSMQMSAVGLVGSGFDYP
jgi:hypothetical protein